MGNLEQRESDGEERGIGFDDDALSEVGETERIGMVNVQYSFARAATD